MPLSENRLQVPAATSRDGAARLRDAVVSCSLRRAQLSTGRTLESSPIRIAVTRAWARLVAPSFW